MDEIFISTDVETDGPIPGPHSMLSLGAAAFVYPKREPISTFQVNLELLEGATPDPDTMKWWREEQPQAWDAARRDLVPPADGIARYVDWVGQLPGIERKESGAIRNAVFLAYPAGFDFTFTYWYIRKFGLQSPFSFSALDIKSFVMAVLGTSFRESVKRNMPKSWFPEEGPHTHVAVEDAIEQGTLFMNMLAQWNEQRAHLDKVLAGRREAVTPNSRVEIAIKTMEASLDALRKVQADLKETEREGAVRHLREAFGEVDPEYMALILTVGSLATAQHTMQALVADRVDELRRSVR